MKEKENLKERELNKHRRCEAKEKRDTGSVIMRKGKKGERN